LNTYLLKAAVVCSSGASYSPGSYSSRAGAVDRLGGTAAARRGRGERGLGDRGRLDGVAERGLDVGLDASAQLGDAVVVEVEGADHDHPGAVGHAPPGLCRGGGSLSTSDDRRVAQG